jgi:hypothetical protein
MIGNWEGEERGGDNIALGNVKLERKVWVGRKLPKI